MDTIKAEDYVLTRDFLGSCRLTGQHYQFVRKYGGLLQPHVDAYLQERLSANQPTAIADIACGNAIWTYDTARKYPQTQLYGFDISSDQFPPKQLQLENIELGILDLFANEMPSELHGKFDIVHIRLVRNVAPGIDIEKMDRAFVNLLKLLKPNGFLQWEENVHPNFNVHDPRSSDPWTMPEGRDMPKFWALLNEGIGGFMTQWKDWDWLASMRAAGFECVEGRILPIIPADCFHESAYWVWVAQEFYQVARKRASGDKAEIVEQAQAELQKILAEGYLLTVNMGLYVGRKVSA